MHNIYVELFADSVQYIIACCFTSSRRQQQPKQQEQHTKHAEKTGYQHRETKLLHYYRSQNQHKLYPDSHY